MLALTKKTDYALVALTHLAQNGGTIATARAIAERYHAPVSLLMNVLKQLSARNIVRSVRGSKGGYALAVRPDSFSLFDLILAIEGPVKFVQCIGSTAESDGSAVCEMLAFCPISRPARQVHDRLERFLKDITLAELAHEMSAGHEVGPVHVGLSTAEKRA